MDAYRMVYRREAFQFRNHLLRLDSDSRFARFGAYTADAVIRRYCAEIDWSRTRIIGYFRDGVLRAATELCYEPGPSPQAVELAFSVERTYQNSRIGSTLMARALILLSNQGIASGHVNCLMTNRRMRTMATRYRSQSEVSCGSVLITIDMASGGIPARIDALVDQMAELLFDPPG